MALFPRPAKAGVETSDLNNRKVNKGKVCADGMPHHTPQSILSNPRLPSLPAVAVRVLELSNEPKTDIKQIARVIQNDQALAAKVIRTVNSSYFGLCRPCADINQAIVYLGLNAVKMLALGFSLVHSVDDTDEWHVNFDYVTYWRRGMHAAAAARLIARTTQSWDPEEAFLAALLQDFGMIAFFRAYGDIYLQAIDLTEGDHNKLTEIEERSFQIDHAQLGSRLANEWNMPAQIVQAIHFHHNAEAAPAKWRPLARTIQLATDAAAVTSERHVERSVEHFKARANEWFNLSAPAVEELLKTMAERASEMADLFDVDFGSPADIDQILMRAEDARVRRHLELERAANQSMAQKPSIASSAN
jgi:two-component system cell cycle response regulator